MKLQLFEGGAATRLAPQLLNVNQGVIYENIDNASGVLQPEKDKLLTDIVATQYNEYFSAEDEWISAAVPTDFLEFQKVMYLTDGVTRPQKYAEGVYNFLGIEEPKLPCILTNTSQAEPIEDISVINNIAAGDLPPSDFEYLLFNVKDGILSIANSITVDASDTALTRARSSFLSKGLVSGLVHGVLTTKESASPRSVDFSDLLGPFDDEAQLYRYYDGAWRLVFTFVNKTDSFSDAVFDVSANAELDESLITPFDGTYQYVYTYYNADDGTESAPNPVSAEIEVKSGSISVTLPEDSTDPQVTHKRLYRVGGNITQFTLVEELDKADTVYLDILDDTELDGRLLESDNYYAAPIGLQFLSEAYAMLFGAIGTSFRFTPIAKPNAWPPEFEIQFDTEITGLGPVANGILVFTRTKTYIVTGTGPLSLAQQSLRGDQGCIAYESVQEASIGTLIWASEDGLCTSSGNNVVSLTKQFLGDTKLDPVSSVVVDEVYYCHNDDGTTLAWDYRFQPIPKWLLLDVLSLSAAKGNLYGYKEGFLHLLYKDTTNLTLKYKSPRFVEGSYSEHKTYKKVYIRSEGDIIINIYITDNLVASFELTTTETHQLQVPQNLQRGYSIQFEIEGTGTVHEIEYIASPTKNG